MVPVENRFSEGDTFQIATTSLDRQNLVIGLPVGENEFVTDRQTERQSGVYDCITTLSKVDMW